MMKFIRGNASMKKHSASKSSDSKDGKDIEDRIGNHRPQTIKHSRSASSDRYIGKIRFRQTTTMIISDKWFSPQSKIYYRSMHHRQRSKGNSTSASTHNLYFQNSLSHQLVPLKQDGGQPRTSKISPQRAESSKILKRGSWKVFAIDNFTVSLKSNSL